MRPVYWFGGVLLLFLWITSRCLAAGANLAATSEAPGSSPAFHAIDARGVQFLTNLFDPALDLLPEYAGAKVYWLFHDNYLAAKILDRERPDLSMRLRASMRKHGVTDSGKIELLFDETAQPFPFRHYVLTNVAEVAGKTIRTEKITPQDMAGWEAYADLLFMAAIARAKADSQQARTYFERGSAMWDGKGFKDVATRHLGRYSTYKLALALIAGQRLNIAPPIQPAVLERLVMMQSASGGWITDYDTAGHPVGLANVETTCLSMLALRGFAIPTTSRAARPPNIIFILADDLGYGDLGCFGQTHIRTPNLDRLAAEGMRFTQHYAGNAVCAPSRCVLLTGKHPGHAWIRDNREVKPEGQPPLPAHTATLANLLRQAGYATAAMGKWGLGYPESEGDPLRQGFDRFYGYNCQRHAHNHYPTTLWENDRQVPLANPEFEAHQKLPATIDPKDAASYPEYRGKDYAPDLIANQALTFIQGHREQPFFLYFATTIPHLALQVPEDSLAEYRGLWPDAPYPGDKGYLPHPSPRAAYAAMITRMDQTVGKMLELVRELGLEEHTLVVFCSDNGPLYERWGGTDADFFQSAGALRGRKGSLYEGGIRVPMIARWLGHIPAGVTSDRVTGFEDWLPTLLELANAKSATPAEIDGISFAPTLRGESQSPRPFLYREFPAYGGWQMARRGDWKAIRSNLSASRQSGGTELYDLSQDPEEKRDVASSHPGIVADLEELMRVQHEPSVLFPLPAVDPAAQPVH